MEKYNLILSEIDRRLNQGQIPKYDDFENLIDQNLKEWLNQIFNLIFLKEYLKQEVREIQILEFNQAKIISNVTEYIKTPFLCQKQFFMALRLLTLRNHQMWNTTNPFVSFKWNFHHTAIRVSVVHPCCTHNGQAKVFFRLQSKSIFNLENYSINSKDIEMLEGFIQNHKNILISGATGSGKTSFLNSMLNLVNKNEHIVILEDTDELITDGPNHTKLISGERFNCNLVDYCRYSMRMSPERIIVGELRSHEVSPFLMALNTGHKGCMASVHANSAIDAVDRLCLLFKIYCSQSDLNFQTIRQLLCNGIDYIIHLENRRVIEIIEIKNAQNGHLSYNRLFSKKEPEQIFA